MSLQLFNVMEESFPEIRLAAQKVGGVGVEQVDLKDSYTRYIRNIDQLDAEGQLTKENTVLAMCRNGAINPRIIASAGRNALNTLVEEHTYESRATGIPDRVGFVYQPGFSSVVVDETGNIIDFYHEPNKSDGLAKYGNQLKYIFRQIGLESAAVSITGESSSSSKGYSLVSELITGKFPRDMTYKHRHHIGGASLNVSSVNSKDKSTIYHAGTSGVLMTDFGRLYMLDHGTVRQDTYIRSMYRRAIETDSYDNFVGNIFAGALDAVLGEFILAKLASIKTHKSLATEYSGDITNSVVKFLLQSYQHGINVD